MSDFPLAPMSFKYSLLRVVDLAGGRSPFPAAAHAGCPRCNTLWEVTGHAWQFECKCRRWHIDVNGGDSWDPIPGARPYCCGREMERAAIGRMYECACGRSVTDDAELAALGSPRVRPARVDDFTVWRSMRDRDRALAYMPPDRHAELCDGLMFGASPDDPDAVSLSEDYCRNARQRVDEWLVSSMDDLMRRCEIADDPFDKRESVMFTAPVGTGEIPGPQHTHWFSFADYSAARSRLLAAKVAASDAARAEADRRIVLGPIDDPDEA